MIDYFLDPILQAPTLGTMLLCLTAAIVGVIVFLRKQSLVGESLSHSAYPGILIGVLIAGGIGISEDEELFISGAILLGAFVTALLGLFTIHYLERKMKLRSDSALCFVLASFFGVGVTLASETQFSYPLLYRQIQIYLYGQAATLTSEHLHIYAILSLAIVSIAFFFYKELEVITFDRDYAKSLGIQARMIDALVYVAITLAIVIGIRSVGVVLMSAMLIAPAVAARQFTNKLYLLFPLAALFGVVSGFLGNYFSVEGGKAIGLGLPTGPMIVLVASSLCLFSLLLAPERGYLWRLCRIVRFRYQCARENVLKRLWYAEGFSFREIARHHVVSPFFYASFCRD